MATDSRLEELEQIQNELDIEIIPGTEIMADIGSHHFVKSEDKSHRVLVPQPSNDPHDPLNWTRAWKLSALVAVSTMSFTQGFAPLALGPMFGYLMQDYDRSLTDVIQFTGVTILVLGFSNFFWVPISTSFGRRPVLIFSQIVCLASHIWRAKAADYNGFMGAAILSGIGAGPGETLQPSIIADIYFLHDRGKWNTMYWVIYTGALIVAPIIAGAMADHSGWPSFWWLNAAMTAVSLVAIVFGFPETMFSRVEASEGQPAAVETSLKAIEVQHEEQSTSEKNTASDDNQSNVNAERDPCLGKGTPSRQQWKLFQSTSSPLRSIMLDLWIPWKLFTFPIVLFASFVVSWSCSFILILNLTQTQVFAAPPYNLSSQSIGFTNFSLFVGALIGLATAGPLSDWVSARATARNNGIREPEMRLPAMIPYVLIMAFGHIITAIGYQNHWPWPVIVVLGYSCAGIQVAGLPSISSTYAVDSYKPVAGSLFVAITVNKNLWGYGMGRFITPWTEADGFINAFMVNMALTFIWCLFAVMFYFYGKTFRRWTKNSNVHRL
ncbi:major facilitator superfamily domain-containing protein [Ilyonectria robusta]|uniref:major facilitator superfamily domain-containing protein n=1 Tax=Ilyonectria robusta TaxID=1079257 RepID=UPI001E8E57E7|nr:major facilitator superfamily domain-containing protein [Ilyonectria robusta]KAH8675197.1 major facilitator superfamily domain-containing protein [Ilyonectria robusta]